MRNACIAEVVGLESLTNLIHADIIKVIITETKQTKGVYGIIFLVCFVFRKK